MTRRIAECECHVCHTIVPKTEAQRREVEKKSGRIGWGWGVSQSTSGTNGRRSFSSGRDLFRNTAVWVCLDCVEDESVVNGVQVPAGVLLVGLIAFAIGWMEAGLVATLLFLFTGFWGWVCLAAFGGASVLAFYGWKRYNAHFHGSED